MDITWKYVKPLRSPGLIEDFETAMVYTFPDSFKACVKAHNGGRPSLEAFNTDQAKERAVKSLLSFNREDKDNIWKMSKWVKADLGKAYIPFAIDNFGNLICFDGGNDRIVFWNHETGRIESVARSFDEFLAALYD